MFIRFISRISPRVPQLVFIGQKWKCVTFTKSKYCYILRRGSTYFGIEGVLSNMVDVDCCIFLKGGTMLYELELIGTFRPLAIEIFNSEIASKTKNKKYPVMSFGFWLLGTWGFWTSWKLIVQKLSEDQTNGILDAELTID